MREQQVREMLELRSAAQPQI